MSVNLTGITAAIEATEGKRAAEDSETLIRISPDGAVHIWSDTTDVATILKRVPAEAVTRLERTPGRRAAYTIEIAPEYFRGAALCLRKRPPGGYRNAGHFTPTEEKT